jgi:hypothetical protein
MGEKNVLLPYIFNKMKYILKHFYTHGLLFKNVSLRKCPSFCIKCCTLECKYPTAYCIIAIGITVIISVMCFILAIILVQLTYTLLLRYIQRKYSKVTISQDIAGQWTSPFCKTACAGSINHVSYSKTLLPLVVKRHCPNSGTSKNSNNWCNNLLL